MLMTDRNKEYVQKCYREILNREPDEPGWLHYTKMLDSNEIDKNDLPNLFKESDEYRLLNSGDVEKENFLLLQKKLEKTTKIDKDIINTISKLYWDLLFRQPDRSGLEFYFNEIKNDHMTLTEIKNLILNSPERNTVEKKINEFNFNFFERKIYSQNGEDGILNFLFSLIGTTNKYAIEIGCDDASECNIRFLLENGWEGLLIDDFAYSRLYTWQISTMKNELRVPQSKHIPEHLLTYLKNEFITKENVNSTLEKYGIPEKIDLLSIDIDYNTFWIWKAIETVTPRVVIVEYNSQFPPPLSKVVPYDSTAKFDWTNYYGGSLMAFVKLGKEKGYDLVGCDNAGTNAFFIRHDEVIKNQIFIPEPEKLFRPPGFGDVWNGKTMGWPISNKIMDDY